MEESQVKKLNRIFKEDVEEPVIIKAPLKELLEELKKVGTVESDKLYSDTIKKYTQVDTSKWDLEVEPDAYDNFIKVLEETECELGYSEQYPLTDEENNMRQNLKVYIMSPVIATRAPYFLEGFTRKNGYIYVSVEDVLKYIISDGEPFVTNLSSLKKLGNRKIKRTLGLKFRK